MMKPVPPTTVRGKPRALGLRLLMGDACEVVRHPTPPRAPRRTSVGARHPTTVADVVDGERWGRDGVTAAERRAAARNDAMWARETMCAEEQDDVRHRERVDRDAIAKAFVITHPLGARGNIARTWRQMKELEREKLPQTAKLYADLRQLEKEEDDRREFLVSSIDNIQRREMEERRYYELKLHRAAHSVRVGYIQDWILLQSATEQWQREMKQLQRRETRQRDAIEVFRIDEVLELYLRASMETWDPSQQLRDGVETDISKKDICKMSLHTARAAAEALRFQELESIEHYLRIEVVESEFRARQDLSTAKCRSLQSRHDNYFAFFQSSADLSIGEEILRGDILCEEQRANGDMIDAFVALNTITADHRAARGCLFAMAVEQSSVLEADEIRARDVLRRYLHDKWVDVRIAEEGGKLVNVEDACRQLIASDAQMWPLALHIAFCPIQEHQSRRRIVELEALTLGYNFPGSTISVAVNAVASKLQVPRGEVAQVETLEREHLFEEQQKEFDNVCSVGLRLKRLHEQWLADPVRISQIEELLSREESTRSTILKNESDDFFSKMRGEVEARAGQYVQKSRRDFLDFRTKAISHHLLDSHGRFCAQLVHVQLQLLCDIALDFIQIRESSTRHTHMSDEQLAAADLTTDYWLPCMPVTILDEMAFQTQEHRGRLETINEEDLGWYAILHLAHTAGIDAVRDASLSLMDAWHRPLSLRHPSRGEGGPFISAAWYPWRCEEARRGVPSKSEENPWLACLVEPMAHAVSSAWRGDSGLIKQIVVYEERTRQRIETLCETGFARLRLFHREINRRLSMVELEATHHDISYRGILRRIGAEIAAFHTSRDIQRVLDDEGHHRGKIVETECRARTAWQNPTVHPIERRKDAGAREGTSAVDEATSQRTNPTQNDDVYPREPSRTSRRGSRAASLVASMNEAQPNVEAPPAEEPSQTTDEPSKEEPAKEAQALQAKLTKEPSAIEEPTPTSTLRTPATMDPMPEDSAMDVQLLAKLNVDVPRIEESSHTTDEHTKDEPKHEATALQTLINKEPSITADEPSPEEPIKDELKDDAQSAVKLNSKEPSFVEPSQTCADEQTPGEPAKEESSNEAPTLQQQVTEEQEPTPTTTEERTPATVDPMPEESTTDVQHTGVPKTKWPTIEESPQPGKELSSSAWPTPSPPERRRSSAAADGTPNVRRSWSRPADGQSVYGTSGRELGDDRKPSEANLTQARRNSSQRRGSEPPYALGWSVPAAVPKRGSASVRSDVHPVSSGEL